ncbi:MAG: Dabb family protein [Candidatus Paceibacterota bacterium]
MSNEKSMRHIVFFRLHANVDEFKRQKAIKLLRELGENSNGVLEWRIEFSLDQRKGDILIENGLFRDAAAYETFKSSEQHQRAGEFMKTISDWLIGDYRE